MRLSWILVLATLSCATLRDDKTVCEEDRGLRCMAGTKCELDKARGFQVCQCESATNTGPDGNPTLNSPPAR